MICVDIDELTPCLKRLQDGKLFDTTVKKVTDEDFLSRYTKETGWYEDWVKLSKENEIYALFVSGSDVVEGLIAIDPRKNRDALYATWMVAAPHNNIELLGKGNQRYVGVGGHLFALAIRKSVEYGCGGAIFGFAKDATKLAHYEKWFGAEHIGILHDFHFVIADIAAINVVEEYNYEYSDEEL